MELTDIELMNVGKNLGNEWKSLAIYLGLGHPCVSRIENDNQRNTANAISCMLNTWYTGETKKKSKRTQLIEALKEVGRHDLAEIVQKSGITTDPYKQSFQESSKETVCKGEEEMEDVSEDHYKQSFQESSKETEEKMEDMSPEDHYKQSFQASSKDGVFEREEKMEDAPPEGSEEEIYKMTSRPRGLCLIINNMQFSGEKPLEERDGSDVDARNLKSFFDECGFTVTVHNDATTEEMKGLIKDASKANHAAYDCFVCCILSHGNEGRVCGSDSKSCEIKYFTDAFLECPTLDGKPKLFFLQVCQGTRKSKPHEVKKDATYAMDAMAISSPDCADVLVAYSTPPGFVSFRNENGSIYIITLITILRKYRDADILEILRRVNSEVSKINISVDGDPGTYKQVPAPQYTLRKKLFLTK